MKLWLLRPRGGLKPDPWDPWYDKAFGFVVRAKTETAAREFAAEDAGDEWRDHGENKGPNPWLEIALSTCVELTADGVEDVVIRDFHAA